MKSLSFNEPALWPTLPPTSKLNLCRNIHIFLQTSDSLLYKPDEKSVIYLGWSNIFQLHWDMIFANKESY